MVEGIGKEINVGNMQRDTKEHVPRWKSHGDDTTCHIYKNNDFQSKFVSTLRE